MGPVVRCRIRPSLQKAFGQPDRQKKGCGFPVAKLVAMFCWASGAVLDVAIGPYRSNELSLWRRLWDQLQAGDVVVGDRFYGAYADLAQLTARGLRRRVPTAGWPAPARSISVKANGWAKRTDCSSGRGRPRVRGPSRPRNSRLAAALTVRVLRFHTRVKGFRSRTIMVATTLLDPVRYPREQMAALYGDRWTVELRLRELKTTLRMDVLRCKSPDVVRKEILMHLWRTT